MHSCSAPKVLNCNHSGQTISRAAVTSLETTIGTHRVDIEDGDSNWVTLTLEGVLNYLIKESPNFRLLIEALLKRAGAYDRF